MGVYPFVQPGVYPSGSTFVQVDEHPTARLFVVRKCPAGYALSDGALGDAEPAGGLLDGYPVQPGV
jgi:hypothetical protein